MFKNRQPILKQNLKISIELSIISIFKTIQGEGPFSGQPSIFVRLGGCNLQCPLCDTNYTTNRKMVFVNDIVNDIKQLAGDHIKLVVITGGEPFRQNIEVLIQWLLQERFFIQIETNGTLFQTISYLNKVSIVCSPKTGSINGSLKRYITHYKYILKEGEICKEDGLPLKALDHNTKHKVSRPTPSFPKHLIYVQPADEHNAKRNELNLKAAIKSCLEFGYSLSLQQHKIIGLD